MHLVPLPALTDNYIWLLHDDAGNALVVDPGQSSVVESALAARKLRLNGILLTHHHADHVGGAHALRRNHDVPIYAPHDERIEAATHRVGDGDLIQLQAPDAVFEVIAVPGHTLTHVAYFGAGLLFCGDTLFSLGCGRLFEGSAEQMVHSLDRLAQLPPDTLVCGGHEYTQANGRFAATVDPTNTLLRDRITEVDTLRSQLLPTMPVSLATELATNPFLRTESRGVTGWCHEHGEDGDRISHFAAMRRAKNEFVA
ncbi:MAG: hydroxyacylglutathione hydrolase [Rhodanobacter sp.]